MRFSRNRPTQKLAYLVVKSKARAVLAARVLQGAEIELLPLRSLLEAATRRSRQSRLASRNTSSR